MKLSLKLLLAFALALGLLFAGALFGMIRLNMAITSYENEVLGQVAAHKKAADIASNFALAIQEWKNVLIRGKEPADMDKHWAAHEKAMTEVATDLQTLRTLVSTDDEKALMQKLEGGITSAREGYKKAFDDFKAAGQDATAGDKAAKGKDRDAAASLKAMRELLSKNEQEIADSTRARASRDSKLAYTLMVVVAAIGMAVGFIMSRKIVQPIEQAAVVAEQVAAGDLTNTIDDKGDDEVGSLLRSLNHMQSSLVTLVSRVRSGSESVANASSEIAAGNNDLSARTEQQASALEKTASSMGELSSTVGHSADSARQASQLATNASNVAQRGGEVVGQVVETMKGINESSRKIADIISVIDGIAFQTNILALNAAVEAARAGEQGRGFAVVASEVRALAGRSADAAKEIKSLINASVERVEHGATLVDQAGSTMQEVVSAIRRVTDIVGEISAASEEQRSGVAQVGQAVTQIDQATQQNAALVEEMAAAATGLKQQAGDLVQTVAVFKLLGGAQPSTDTVGRSAPKLAPAFKKPSIVSKPPSAKPALTATPKSLPSASAKPNAKPSSGGDADWETF